MTIQETAALLQTMDRVLLLTHIRPDGDTIGSAAALCQALRDMGKTAYLLPNAGTTETYQPYAEGYWGAEDFKPDYVVSVDIAALSLLPENAKKYAGCIHLAIDHHPSNEGFAPHLCVMPEMAACGEIIYEIVHLLTPVTKEIALPLYVENIPGIAKARADEAVANGFTTVRNVAGVISIALIAILLLVSVFIISNTIKLTTFDRRDEIAIMKMVGATNGFIRWPFVYEGLLLGLFSAVIAFGLQWGLYAAVAQGIANSDSLQILRVVPFTEIWYYVALVFLGAGILVGVGGSLTAIRKFLRV